MSLRLSVEVLEKFYGYTSATLVMLKPSLLCSSNIQKLLMELIDILMERWELYRWCRHHLTM